MILIIIAVWVIGAIGCLVMKKISPENFVSYLVHVLVVCICFTLVSFPLLNA